MRLRVLGSMVALALCVASSDVPAQRVAPAAVARSASIDAPSTRIASLPRASSAFAGRGMPTWVKWGLVGAVAGAVTFPLLGSMASDSRGNAAGDAVAGAAIGFVVVGGSVALWQAVCGGDSPSRRAGLCGR